MTEAERKRVKSEIKKLNAELLGDYIPQMEFFIDNPACAFEAVDDVIGTPPEKLDEAVSKLARLVKLELFLGVYEQAKKRSSRLKVC